MIKKIIYKLFIIFFILFFILIISLSTFGIETNRFNNLISNNIEKTKNIKLQLKTIKFKIDPKDISLFLETKQPIINFKNIIIPSQNIKVYIDFLSLIKTEPNIKKINIILTELDINQLNELSKFIKPSNFKSFVNNNITDAQLKAEIEIFLNKEGNIDNYILRGDVKNIEANLLNGIRLLKTKFNFFADKEDILIKKFFGKIENIKINDGDLKLNFNNGIKLNSNFNTQVNLRDKNLDKFKNILKKFDFTKRIKNVSGEFNNNISLNFDDTLKLIDYDYNIIGKLDNSTIKVLKSFNNNIIKDKIEDLHLSDIQIKSNLSPKKLSIVGEGKYSFNNLNFLELKLDCSLKKDLLKINANFDYGGNFDLDLINYKKPKDDIANVSIEFEKNKNISYIKKLNIKEQNNFININNLKFEDNNFVSFNKLDISNINNDFSILWDKKIIIKGRKFDATNFTKLFNQQGTSNKFKNINTNIEIDFKTIKVPLSEKLNNFRLIGEIKKGKFIKISSKGDFGGNNFLDISLKKDKESEKKYLEIYSDLTQPLLTEYSFFKGLTGGKLLFTSLIDGSKSNSRLKIENFKVINAPGVIKLLSLADLGGLVDLAEGEGLSFDLLEINMEKDKKLLQLNEILALGPSMSVLIEGYQDNTGLTSLKGTLVPAKTLNKMISKIPVIGNIVIPKEIGEGLFGISFKMKGPKGKIKTTINPIRTLTPRFIQKIVDKNKASN